MISLLGAQIQKEASHQELSMDYQSLEPQMNFCLQIFANIKPTTNHKMILPKTTKKIKFLGGITGKRAFGSN